MLDWTAIRDPLHARRLALTRSLLDARNRAIVPLLPAMKSGGEVGFDDGVLSARWAAGAKILELLANLSDAAKARPVDLQWSEQFGAASLRANCRPGRSM
jgi:hypothetical protein